jgi:hypothetical protein
LPSTAAVTVATVDRNAGAAATYVVAGAGAGGFDAVGVGAGVGGAGDGGCGDAVGVLVAAPANGTARCPLPRQPVMVRQMAATLASGVSRRVRTDAPSTGCAAG